MPYITYVHPNILISPEADAQCFVEKRMICDSRRGETTLQYRLHDYRKDNIFFDTFISEVQRLLQDSNIKKALGNIQVKIFGQYPEEGGIDILA